MESGNYGDRLVKKYALPGFIGSIGLGLITLAVFAQELGIGHSNRWGLGRKIVVAIGILFALVALFAFLWPFIARGWVWLREAMGRLLGKLMTLSPVRAGISRFNDWKVAWDHWPPVWWYVAKIRLPIGKAFAKVRNSSPFRYIADSQDHAAALTSAILGIGVVATYVWFVSVGRWTDWPKTTSYYQQLADAFGHGQVSLLEQPDPALLKLADPYQLSNRQNIAYPWDVVLYQGKFYLYWGPAPALILTGVHFLYKPEIDDQVLVFAFVTGAFIFSSQFILQLRKHLFPSLGWPYVIPGILLAGFANPMPWLLNRPAVYEAAIASGQFFLMASLFLIFTALGTPRRGVWKLALSGVCLALAVASRASLALAAGFLVLMAAWYIYRGSRKFLAGTLRLAALAAPLAIGLGGVGWYNEIRFGSWLEFGFQYQLTGMNTHVQTFSPANLLINLHNYLLNPYRTLPIFPYIKPNWGGHFIFFPISSPSNYYSEQVSGLLVTVPYILLAAIPILYLLRIAWHAIRRSGEENPSIRSVGGDGLFNWTVLCLSGAAIMAFGPILLFIAATMRYLGDAVPLLVLLSTLGFWLVVQFLSGKPVARGWFVTLVIVLTVFSALVSLLLAVTGYESRFENLNPVLFAQLTRLLSP